MGVVQNFCHFNYQYRIEPLIFQYNPALFQVMAIKMPELEVVKTLSWSFMKLLLIAGVIALPVGYLGGTVFNDFFTFNAGLNYGLMTLFFAAVFISALFTIGFYAMRTALVNPVTSLRAD
jgi:hypothetical protein